MIHLEMIHFVMSRISSQNLKLKELIHFQHLKELIHIVMTRTNLKELIHIVIHQQNLQEFVKIAL